MESHVVARLQLDPPTLVLIFWRSWNEPEGRTKSLNRKRLHFYALVFNGPQLRYAFIEQPPRLLTVHLGAWAEIINSSLAKLAIWIKEKYSKELPSSLISQSRNERRRYEELRVVLCGADTVCMVVVVVYCDQGWRCARHRAASIAVNPRDHC